MFEQTNVLAVRCDPTAAFDHIARGFFEHHGLWDPSVTGMSKTSDGAMRAGTAGIERRRFGPLSVVSEIVVTSYEPDGRFGFRTTKGPMSEQVDFVIEASATGSSVRQHLRLIPEALPLRIMEPLMRPILARNVARNTERLRAALEAAAIDPRMQEIPASKDGPSVSG